MAVSLAHPGGISLVLVRRLWAAFHYHHKAHLYSISFSAVLPQITIEAQKQAANVENSYEIKFAIDLI